MIDTRVNSGWAKAIIATFVVNIINSKSVPKTTFTRGEFIRVNVETDKIYPYLFVACRCNPEKQQSKRTDLDKTNTGKKVAKVLPDKIFILIMSQSIPSVTIPPGNPGQIFEICQTQATRQIFSLNARCKKKNACTRG